jgi:16S rRNA (adenine1518-N6/adenine1519-N6)-dimethyltransferase
MTPRERLAADLAAAGCQPLHRLGQNFMVEPAAVAALVGALGAADDDVVVEIGPGTGILTRALLAAGHRVLAVELDRGLAAWLPGAIADARFALVHGDCLAGKNALHPAIVAAASAPWRLGANLPYDAALPALLNAVALPRPPTVIAATVQHEAAERLCSRPGADAWGASAAVFQAAGSPRIVRKLAPGCFHPAPRVDSAIIHWTPAVPLPPGFGRWCRTLFSFRRKVLPRALRDAGLERDAAQAALTAAGLDATRRVEELDASELRTLFAHAAGPSPQ